MTPDYYYYLNQSDTYKVDGTDDRSDFSETLVSTRGHVAPSAGNAGMLQVGQRQSKSCRVLPRAHSTRRTEAGRAPTYLPP